MSGVLSPEATAEAFEHGVVALDGEVDVVRCAGPQAREYLQGQCSQDLSGLAPGDGADALVLSVQGKLVALVRVWALGEDDFGVSVAAGYGEALYERLRRFKIRVKAELGLERWAAVQVRGPGSTGVEEAAVGALAQAGPDPEAGPGAAGRPPVAAWPAVDLVGSATLVAKDLPRGDPETFEAARIEAGVPAMGSELDERTIPHEAGVVAWTVSFTKGCYTGQELVARIDARGARVPKVLRGLVVEAPTGAVPPVGAALSSGGREVGPVTSVARSPFAGAAVGLCYVRRDVELPARCTIEAGEVPVTVEVRALPLRGAPEP